MKAKDVMTAPVVTGFPDTLLRQAAKLFISHGFSTLPVVDEDDHLLGVVTEGDLLAEPVVPSPRAPGDVAPPATLEPLLTRDVVTADTETPVALLTRLMLDERARAIPIVDGELRVVGIVARRDLLRSIAPDDQVIARDVRYHLSATGQRRWQVTVAGGMVSLSGDCTDETERQIATVVAGSLPGVIGVHLEDGP
ncbi:MAG TPA: CBS domain-containing protein [Amycolatopsis sp.]|nr:CBS domain-containing protein [Amycolatopsis sp.]